MTRVMTTLAFALLAGCATPSMLPKPSEVDFSAVGYFKGSGWHDGAVFDANETETVAAIKAALAAHSLGLQEFDERQRKFVAESPMNLHRWASYVAVYYRPVTAARTEVHVVTLGTKDINVLADDSEAPISPRVVASIGTALSKRKS